MSDAATLKHLPPAEPANARSAKNAGAAVDASAGRETAPPPSIRTPKARRQKHWSSRPFGLSLTPSTRIKGAEAGEFARPPHLPGAAYIQEASPDMALSRRGRRHDR